MEFICNQTYMFLGACLAGVLVGLIFDIFRVKRKLVETSDLIVYIEDILYWLIIAIVLFLLMYYSNEGELRGYLILGILIGMIFYILTLSQYVMSFLVYIIRLLGKVFVIVLKILIFPIRIILKIFRKPIKFLLKIVKRVKRKILWILGIMKLKMGVSFRILKKISKKK